MAGHYNSDMRGSAGLLKTHYNRNKAAGEKAMGFEYSMKILQHPELNVLVRSSQYPAFQREDVEDTGNMGLKFTQYGALINSGEITFTLAETIQGMALKTLKDIVFNKQYVDIEIALTPESSGCATTNPIYLRDCTLKTDAVDLANEDTTAIIKPSVTAHYNWIE